MTPTEFRDIRKQLGFTQAGLAAFLDYSHSLRISEFERGEREVPRLLAMLMRAYAEGYRPKDWPLSK